MSSADNQVSSTNVSKYIAIALAVVVVGGGIAWLVSNEQGKQKATETALASVKAELAAQKNKESEVSASVGSKSSKLYADYMKRTLSARSTAVQIRLAAEGIKTMLQASPELNSNGSLSVREALAQSAAYYKAAAAIGSSVDFRDVDADLIAYIRKNQELDLEAKEIYDNYAATGQKPDEYLVALTTRRDRLIDNDEAKLITKFASLYGQTLAPSSQLRTEAEEKLMEETKAFANALTPERVAQAMIGRTFTNLQNERGPKWTLAAAEFVTGSFQTRKSKEGTAVVVMNMQVKNPRTNNTGLLLAIVVYAKPADSSNLEWPIIWALTP